MLRKKLDKLSGPEFTVAVILFIILLMLALPFFARANELPDMPTPKPRVLPVRSPERFWTRPIKIEAGVLAGALIADSALTCSNLAHGGHEDWLPTQSCPKAVAIMAGADVGAIGLAWLLNRTGHHRLAKVPMLYQAGGHFRAIVYSKEHKAW